MITVSSDGIIFINSCALIVVHNTYYTHIKADKTADCRLFSTVFIIRVSSIFTLNFDCFTDHLSRVVKAKKKYVIWLNPV